MKVSRTVLQTEGGALGKQVDIGPFVGIEWFSDWVSEQGPMLRCGGSLSSPRLLYIHILKSVMRGSVWRPQVCWVDTNGTATVVIMKKTTPSPSQPCVFIDSSRRTDLVREKYRKCPVVLRNKDIDAKKFGDQSCACLLQLSSFLSPLPLHHPSTI